MLIKNKNIEIQVKKTKNQKQNKQTKKTKASILRRSAFFTVQLSHPYMTTGKTLALFTTEQKLPLEVGRIVPHGVCSEVNWKYYCLYLFVR